jgi:hypothetical protein
VSARPVSVLKDKYRVHILEGMVKELLTKDIDFGPLNGLFQSTYSEDGCFNHLVLSLGFGA